MKTRWILVVGLVAALSLLASVAAFAGGTCDLLLGDYVWVDTNEDGLQNDGATGVAGVTVTLIGRLRPTAPYVTMGSTVTDGDGYYIFQNLDVGQYYLQFELPTGFTWTSMDQGADDANDSDVDPATGETLPFLLGILNGVPTCLDDLTRDAGVVSTFFENPGCGTPGYWKNHPDAWPVDSITIGGVTYTKAAAIDRMSKIDKKDMRYLMFMHLVSAKLNVMIGNSDLVIGPWIVLGDAWMAQYAPVGLPDEAAAVTADSYAWQEGLGEEIKDWLDDYNNGLLDAPHRD